MAASDATIESEALILVIRKVVTMTPPLAPGVAAAAAAFWQARRVRFSHATGSRLVGRRGSLWWNAVTFDMSKLRTDVVITMDVEAGAVACELRVNRLLQAITGMNRPYWIEELNAFESAIVRGDDRAAQWQEFKRGYDKATVGWVLAIAVVVTIAIASRELISPLLSWLMGLFGG